MNRGPLDGIRVVDFGHQVAGPLTAALLADHGADVVHVDNPRQGGTGADSADAYLQHGKRRITLDLTDQGDRDVAARLVERADVVIENFRPGVMDRFGLGWSDLKERAPRLVYCSLPGFGSTDPRADVPGWEGVIDAATGNFRPRPSEHPDGWDLSRPTFSAVPVASNFAASLAAFGIVAALNERLRSGRGQRVEVPLHDAVFEAIGAAGAYVGDQGPPAPRPLRANGGGTFRCSDGAYVQFNPIGTNSRFLRWFLQAAGVSGWAAEGLTDLRRVRLDPQLGAELTRRVGDVLATRTADEWEDLAARIGVPLCRIRSGAEWMAEEHARASGAVVQRADPLLGPVWTAGPAVDLGASPGHPDAPRHRVDQDRAEILAELAGPWQPHASVEETYGDRLPPYAGLRVLDLTQILAGPSSARLLAEFGAEVVKLNAPQRSVAAHGLVNRGKRSLLVDVESSEGQDVFWALVDSADVVVQNFPAGTAERYGIGYEQVRERRPDIVYVSVTCYDHAGPWAERRGYETQGQAVTGISERHGGQHGPAVLGPYNVLDYGTGVLAAFGAALALYHRAVGGGGQQVFASLARTGTLHQASLLTDVPADVGHPRGQESLGSGPLQRFYAAADGWFFLGATPEQEQAVRQVAGAPHGALDEALEQRFPAASAQHWVDQLGAAGIGAHRAVGLAELMTDPVVRERGLSIDQEADDVGMVTMPGPAFNCSATPPRHGRAAGRPGSDAVDVLAELDLPVSVEELERRWAVQLADLPAAWT